MSFGHPDCWWTPAFFLTQDRRGSGVSALNVHQRFFFVSVLSILNMDHLLAPIFLNRATAIEERLSCNKLGRDFRALL